MLFDILNDIQLYILLVLVMNATLVSLIFFLHHIKSKQKNDLIYK